MRSSTSFKTKSGHKRGRYLLLLLIILGLYGVFSDFHITMNGQYTIEKGDTYYSLIQDLGWYSRMRMKHWMRQHETELPELKPGVVVFSGSYDPQQWIDIIDQSTSTSKTIRLTLLEGWSSYDIDAKLQSLGLINSGEYHQAITDPATVSYWSKIYPWLSTQYGSTLPSLEGYLYPDTYFIDTSKPIIDQVIRVQLKAYQDKVHTPYGSQITSFSRQLKQDGFEFDISPYSLIKLASVIENEEKATKNKPIIAGIFLNRIQDGMRLDADVTLCYGKAVTYTECTPQFIVKHLYDDSNLYNTRRVSGLPPTPISNPSVTTITSLLGYKKSNYLYYLHDAKGIIYPAASIEEHNANKVTYLQ